MEKIGDEENQIHGVCVIYEINEIHSTDFLEFLSSMVRSQEVYLDTKNLIHLSSAEFVLQLNLIWCDETNSLLYFIEISRIDLAWLVG